MQRVVLVAVLWCLLWSHQGGVVGCSPEQSRSHTLSRYPSSTGISVSTCVPVPPSDKVLKAFSLVSDEVLDLNLRFR